MTKEFKIEFYQTEIGNIPVKEFLRTQSKDVRMLLGHGIYQLELKGPDLTMPLSRSIQGYSDLYELRLKGEDNIYRVIYFYFTGKTYILLHAFIKKSQKTPKKEIELAEKRRKDFLLRRKID